MAAKTIPSGGLSAASNPSARLQELLRTSPALPNKNTEKNVEDNTETYTENNTHSHTGFIADSPPQENAESLPLSYTEQLPSIRVQRRKPVKAQAAAASKAEAAASSSNSVRQRIVEDLQKEPVVRKTIDIPASLNERLQDYCAAKRIKTERRVFLVLLENFLEEEGF